MASVIHVYLVLFVFAGCFFSCAQPLARKYISLTSDVQNYFKTSSVFFIFSQYNRALEEYTVLHMLSREFSQKGTLTLVINFMELGERVTFYRKQILRPLIVVLLNTKYDVDAFIRNTRNMAKSYPIWLVIFEGESGDAICRYCNFPIANIFDLRFDTEMLIMCCNNPVLREWWSNHENRTEEASFANWTEEGGLERLTAEGLYTRRNSVNGAGLRIAIVPKSSNLVVDYGNTTVGGFFGDILQELSRDLNFTITKTLRKKTFGSWSSLNKKWSGVVGQLVAGNADFGVAEFSMTSRRLGVVDFTLPFLTTKSQLFIKKPDGFGVKWIAYFQAFTVSIWLTILILIISSPVLLALIQVQGSSVPLFDLIFQNYISVWGIFCMQGLREFPRETPLRIAYFSIFISALVVSSSYSASLTSYLAVSSATLPFASLDGLLRDGSYKLIVYPDSSDYDFFAASTDPLLKKMMSIMKPRAELSGSAVEIWDQVCDERVALFTNQAMKQTEISHIKCEISEIDTGRVDSLAMIMTANNEYTDVINYHIQRFHDNGILNRLKNKHFVKLNAKKTTYDEVTLLGIVPVLTVFGSGIILAFFLLLCEQIHCSFMKNIVTKWSASVSSQKMMLPQMKFRNQEGHTQRNLRLHAQWQTGFYNNSYIGYFP